MNIPKRPPVYYGCKRPKLLALLDSKYAEVAELKKQLKDMAYLMGQMEGK